MAANSWKTMEYEFVEELTEELTCSICLKVLCQPHMMNCCEKKFCAACLEGWLDKQHSCPQCRSTDFSHMLMRQISRKVSELRVYCPNKKHGCQSILKLGQCNAHLSSDGPDKCSYVQRSCPMCSSQVFHGEMEKHVEKLCPRRQVTCSYCELQAEHQFIVGEHLNSCPLYNLECPKQCGATILRKDIDSHKEMCPAELVMCPFSSLGCKVKVQRKDLEKHIETSTLEHMMELAKSHLELKAQHEELEKKHDALKSDYESIKSDCATHKRLNNSISKLMRGLPFVFSENLQVSQIQTLLSSTTTISMEKPLVLTLSETNVKTGYHYINVHKAKFKLEWEWVESDRERMIRSADSHLRLSQQSSDTQHTSAPRYRFRMYACNLQNLLQCDVEIGISRHGDRKNYIKHGAVCCSSSISQDSSQLCFDTFGYPCKLASNLQIGIKFLSHNKHDCKCDCHHGGVSKERTQTKSKQFLC